MRKTMIMQEMDFRPFAALLALVLVLAACGDSAPTPPEDDDPSAPTPEMTGVVGTVLDADGEPVESARVEAIPADAEPGGDAGVGSYVRSDETNEDGEFSIEIEQTGQYTIVVKAEGVGAAETSVEVEVSGSGKSTVEITLTVDPVATVEGRVTLAEASDNLGIDVFIPGTSFVARTDGEGAFRLEGVPPGEWTVVMQQDGYARAEQEITVSPGDTIRLEGVALEPIEPLEIHDFTASPARGVAPLEVEFAWDASDPSGESVTCVVDADSNGVPEHEGGCATGNFTYTYEEAGAHQARLRVVGERQRAAETITIDVTSPDSDPEPAPEPEEPEEFGVRTVLNAVPEAETYLYDRVAVSNEFALVGVPTDPEREYASGQVEVYRRDAEGSWGHASTITPNVGVHERFGWQLSMSGDTVAIASERRIENSSETEGVVYIYEHTSGGEWRERRLLLEDEGVDPHGMSIDLAGDTLVIGAQGGRVGTEPEASFARVFERDAGGADAWGETGSVPVVERDDNRGTGFFGIEIAISSDGMTLAVGDTMQNDDSGIGTYVHIYERADKMSAWRHARSTNPFSYSVMLEAEGDTVAAVPMASREIHYAEMLLYQRDAGGEGAWGRATSMRLEVTTEERNIPYNVLLSISMTDSTLAAGIAPAMCTDHAARTEGERPCDGGRVYVFERDHGGDNAWGTFQIIEDQEHPYDSSFGEYVDLSDSGETLLVGGHIREPAEGSGSLRYTHIEVHERP